MREAVESRGDQDLFELSRFIKAQDSIYDRVLLELRSGATAITPCWERG